jgi:hypothetical protein
MVVPLVSVGLHYNTLGFYKYQLSLFLNEDNVGEFLIDMSRLFQSETVDGINEIADVLSLHLGGT